MDIQEDIVIDGANFNFYYEGETFTLPRKILETADLSEIVNMKVIREEFNEE